MKVDGPLLKSFHKTFTLEVTTTLGCPVDCIVLPSYYREGTPRTLLESASMAKPIITTDNVGCRDVVDDGINGFLCKIKNVKDLSEKMEMMLDLSQEERNIMGEKGREKMIREYDENIVIYKYLNVIKKIEVAK